MDTIGRQEAGAGTSVRFAGRTFATAPPRVRALRYRPVLDVARGVAAGYESVSAAFPGGVSDAELRQVLRAFGDLPRNTLMMVPIELTSLASPAIRAALLRPTALAGIVFDLIGAPDVSLSPDAVTVVAEIRAAGGMIALGGGDDPQPSITSIAAVRPSIIRLGRAWVDGIDVSLDKCRAVEEVGRRAAERDAWILADDVRTGAELRTLAELGVPLAKGPFVGPTGSDWPAIDVRVHRSLPTPTGTRRGPLRELLVAVPCVYLERDALALLRSTATTHVVVTDTNRRPVALARAGSDGLRTAVEILRVNVDTPMHEVVRRAAARDADTRHDPIAATDNAGRFLGLVTLPV